jgi:pilus assembly protein CpaB
MWKVTRMNRARIVVLTTALGAGGVAAYLPSGSDSRPTSPARPVAQLHTADVLVAKSDIGPGQTTTSNILTAVRQAGTLPLALHSITDVTQAQLVADDRSRTRPRNQTI